MKDVTEKNFGVVIAFWLPGFLFLWGLSYSVADVGQWFANSRTSDMPTVGGFLYVTLASLACGLVISAFRGTIFDNLLYWLHCLDRPDINYSALRTKDTLVAFQSAIENHYRYYQYYSHSLIAVVAAFVYHLVVEKSIQPLSLSVTIAAVSLVLLFASRNELKRFNERANRITHDPNLEIPL